MKDKEALEEPLLPVAENQQQRPKKSKSCCRKFVDNAFVKMFVVCFLAEWGDRSQLTAMALAAANDMYGVWLGGSVVSKYSYNKGACVMHIDRSRVRHLVGWVYLAAHAHDYQRDCLSYFCSGIRDILVKEIK